jgi:hypothetical protein
MSIAIPVIVGIVVVAVLLLLRTRRGRADTVQGDAPESPFPATAGGAILRRYATAISDPGVDETRLAALGQELAGASAEVMPALAETWRATPEQEIGLRWALVYSAAVAGPAAVPFLREVVLAPVPPERSPDPHSYSTRAWDSIVRSRAVGGLESLAAAGAPGAESALFECLSHELFSVRALSAVALVSLPGGVERRERVRRALPEAERSVIGIQRVRVSVVPQIRDPRKHLASPVGHWPAPPPSPRGERAAQPVRPSGPRPRRRGMRPPTISGGENG